MLMEKAKDTAFWERVRTSEAYRPFVDELLALWERDCVPEIPACKYSEFILFNRNGSRKEYEASYFRRRRAMNTAALLSLIYPDNEEYFTRLCDVIWAILDEYVWVLPAHMPSFDEIVPHHIDLFASETAGALSEIDFLMADRLPALIRNRIRLEVRRRVIDGYRNERFSWETNTANWATVCLCGVVMAVLYQQPELMPELLPRFSETVRCYLSGFAEDGICLEGIGYWHYGFGYFMGLADLIRQYSGGEVDYFTLPKIAEIAKFPQRAILDGTSSVSFSDGGMTSTTHIGMIHYLKKEFPDDVVLPDRKYTYTNDGCGRWLHHLRAILWFDETLDVPEGSAQKTELTDYAPDSQWMIRKTPFYRFAAKGGNNGEPHNHNDLGSFIVTRDGRQVLCDPGAGVYSREYFRGERYQFFKASSRGHSVPIIGGCYQQAGSARSADSSWENDVFTVEFSRGYDLPALTSLKRSFAFTEDTIVLTDELVLTEELPVVERIVSRFPAEITEDGVLTGGLKLVCGGEADVSVHEEENLFCIDFALKPGARRFTLNIAV